MKPSLLFSVTALVATKIGVLNRIPLKQQKQCKYKYRNITVFSNYSIIIIIIINIANIKGTTSHQPGAKKDNRKANSTIFAGISGLWQM